MIELYYFAQPRRAHAYIYKWVQNNVYSNCINYIANMTIIINVYIIYIYIYIYIIYDNCLISVDLKEPT